MSAYDIMTAGMSGVGLVLLGLVTVSGTSEYHLNAAQMQSKLETNAREALAKAGHSWADVQMDGQQAQLSGAPPSVDAAEAAKAAVLTSSGRGGLLWGGVRSVHSDFSEIRDIETVSPYVWRAVKDPDGGLVLVGAVPDDDAKTALAAHAAQLSAGGLDDRAKLALGVPSGDWVGVAKFGLDQLALLNSGEARLTDHELRLAGIAMDDAARIQATASIAGIDAPWTGVPDIDGPSHWKAEHVDGTLLLSGRCETAAHRAEIAAIAQQYFDGPVQDEMRVEPSEYEPWIDGVRLGLPHFTQFESGEMKFDPVGDGFEFNGEATSSTLAFLREDMETLPGAYAVEIETETISVELDEIAGIDLGDDALTACQTAFDLIMDANAVVFERGSAAISRESGVTLDKIMAVSETCADTLQFEIGGHTDISGQRDANIALSTARAQAVSNYMQAAGFDTARLAVKGYGPDQPKSDNATAQGRAANRRIEFTVQEWSE
ncbi:MAG: OmpA family protein [Pseudomonadota bacterium]